ncbi:MAG: rhomboid family intramembrane serine protease [Acidobacteriota bacterium]
MVNATRPSRPVFDLTGGPPPPPDLLALMAVVFATFSLSVLGVTPLESLRLTPDVWQRGFLWQLVTYPFIGIGSPGLWFLVELFILYLFGRDVRLRLGRRGFWWLLGTTAAIAAVAAVMVELLAGTLGFGASIAPFALMQGQRMLLTVFIAAFAVINRDATIYLFFVLPIRAGHFLWIEILFAFMGFLATRDIAGFLGVCAAVGGTMALLHRGGPKRLARDTRLRLEKMWITWRLRKQRGRFGVVDGRGADRPSTGAGKDGGNGSVRKGPWIH